MHTPPAGGTALYAAAGGTPPVGVGATTGAPIVNGDCEAIGNGVGATPGAPIVKGDCMLCPARGVPSRLAD